MRFLLLSGVRHTVNIKGKELAKEIAERLHKMIGVEGEATWDIDTWKLSAFTAESLVEYKEHDPVEAFEALSAAAGDFWNDVDPDAYVSELRSD